MSDFQLTDHGSIWLLNPVTKAAQEWVADNIPDDAQRHGNAVAIEPRYVDNIVEGVSGAGLRVQS